ncbi:hypothetical protein pb186bvf_017471 [Paramecium bursaria]
MYQGIITLPRCGICTQMMLGDLVCLIDCGDTMHNQCFEQFRVAKKCPICKRKFSYYKNIIYQAEEHYDLNNQDIIPLCVTQKFQQYEAAIQQGQSEIRQLQNECEELDKAIELQKKLNDIGPQTLFELLQGSNTRIKEQQLEIEKLEKKTKSLKKLQEQEQKQDSKRLQPQ